MHLVFLISLFQGVTLFGQDLGGPTGLSVVRHEKSRFRKLVLLNTWAPQGDIFSSTSFAARHAAYLAWRAVSSVLGRSVPIRLVFTVASDISPTDVAGYVAPYPSNVFKAGPAQWPLLVPLTSDEPMALEMQKVRRFLEVEWTGPVLYGYSDGERFTIPGGDLFRELFKNNGCEVRIKNSGHFVQEDQPEVVSSLLINFVNHGC